MVKNDLAVRQVGEAGHLDCTPVSMAFPEESKTVFQPAPAKYGVRFAYEHDPGTQTTTAGREHEEGNNLECYFGDSRTLAVANTTEPQTISVAIQ